MKSWFRFLFFFLLFVFTRGETNAQCSVCTKTAQQLGDGPAAGMNSGIIYLAFVPLAIVGYISFRWWQSEKAKREE
jgi:hypothetical protein